MSLGARAELDHPRDDVRRDAGDRAAPARVRRADHARAGIGEHERDAVGGERAEHRAEAVGDEAVELGAIGLAARRPSRRRAVDVPRDRASCAGS